MRFAMAAPQGHLVRPTPSCCPCLPGTMPLPCGECTPDDDDEIGEGDPLLEERVINIVDFKDLHRKERVRPLADPKDMTPEQRARHKLTHLPYHDTFRFCGASSRNTTPHRHSTLNGQFHSTTPTTASYENPSRMTSYPVWGGGGGTSNHGKFTGPYTLT